MRYDLRKPCDLCPFRNDHKRLYVPVERMLDMASGEFCCHKTAAHNDETSEYEPDENSQHCAGALIFLENIGRPHQMMRIAERLGFYNHTKLDMNSPVFKSIDEARTSQKQPE